MFTQRKKITHQLGLWPSVIMHFPFEQNKSLEWKIKLINMLKSKSKPKTQLSSHSSSQFESMDTALLTALSLLLLTLLYFIYRTRRSPSLRLPPSPPSLPLLGHLHLLLFSSSPPHHTFSSLSSRLGPLLYLRLGQIPTVVISSPSLARAAITSPLDPILSSRPNLLSSRVLSFSSSDITFSPSGPYHRLARRLAVHDLLSPTRVAAFSPIRRQEISLLLSSVLDSLHPAQIDMSARFLALSNAVLCHAAFGRRHHAGDRTDEVLAEAQRLFAGFSMGDFFPVLESTIGRVTGLTRRLESCLADLRAVCDEIIEEHVIRDKKSGKKEEEDFLDVLLRAQRSPNLEVPITDDNVKALVLDMYVAGTDTTYATLEWVMTELIRHPHIMKKAQQEVRALAGINGSITEADVHHLPYLKSVIKETFRLHPPVPLLVPRESTADCVLDGYDIPAKTRIFINVFAIGRDPKTWTNPLQFDPDRFAGGEIDVKGQNSELLPFGGGRRGCPGYSFALATTELALASILYHFDWELPPGIGVEDVDMSEIFGLATRKKEPLVLVARKAEGYEFKGIE